MSNIIDTDLTIGRDKPLANVKLEDSNYLLLGMYVGGKVERMLFNMNRKQVEQLVEYLNQIKNIMK